MYDELVKRVRKVAEEVCEDYDVDPYNAEQRFFTIEEAADAIEELSRENESLAKSVNEASEILRKRWIPVEERLPQETQRCIVASKCGEMAFAIYRGNGFQYPHYMGKATHWMPQPQAPQEECA